MPADPTKVAKRTLFEAERIKAEAFYKRLLKVVMKKIRRLIATLNPWDDVYAKLQQFAQSKVFRMLCRKSAKQIVTMLAVGQQRSWRQAASLSSNGRKIFLALQKELKTTSIGNEVQRIIDDNAKLIQTVPQNLARQFSRMAGQTQYAGKRPEELVAIFKQKAPHLTDVEARRIARTETGKAATALTQARCDKLGISLYRWYTCHDLRVRDSHEFMDNVICAWDDPPNPELLSKAKKSYGNYHPHGIFNCRCEALPVVSLNDIEFPARVHYHGSIRTINNRQQLFALLGRTAARYEA